MKKKILLFCLLVLLCIGLVFYIFRDNTKISPLENISIQIKEGTLTNTGTTILITDLSEDNNIYGEWFRIDKREKGKWKELKANNTWFNLSSYYIDENNELELEQNWESIYGKLESGEYRLVKKVNNEYISVSFKID